MDKVNSSNNFFSTFGKIVLALLIVGCIGYAGYYIGTHNLLKKVTPQTVQVSPTRDVNQLSPTQSQLPTVSPTTPPTGKKVTAGMQTTFFKQYAVIVPPGWVDKHESDSAAKTDKLTITKNGYILTISQAAGGGGSCIFPGGSPQPMSQAFTSFIEISGASAQYRRGTSDGISYTICEKRTESWGFPTSYGYITYIVPKLADQSVIKNEMDEMVASLTNP